MKKTILTAFVAGLLSSFVGGTLGIIAASPYSSERTEAVFVYGTLLNPLTRTYACLCATKLRPVVLTGYARTVRNIIPAPNSQVRGGVIVVSQKELARLDAYEGVPGEYTRERILLGKQYVWVYQKVK